MLPAVLLARHHDRVAGGPVDDTASGVLRHVRKGVLQFVAASPNLFCAPGGRIRDPNTPRMRTVRPDEVALRGIPRNSRPPKERQLFSVWGPDRSRIAVHARRKELDAFRRHIVNSNEAVVGPLRSKRELRTVRRPLLPEIRPAYDELHRFLRTVERSKPDLPVSLVGNHTARRNSRAVPGVNSTRFPAAPGNGPNVLFRARRIARGVGILPRGIFVAAANVHNCVPVRGKTHRGQLLAIVL